jgi:hypothetical protein
VKVGHWTLALMWTGTIENGMHEKIEAEFDKAKDRIKRVDLYLNSCGGSIREMEATIVSLRHIKKTHRLETEVGWAHECASACVPIFLQGQIRFGALTSSWLFHEAGRGELEPVGRPPDKVTVERELTERLFNDYFLPVSEKWLDRLRGLIKNQDYFQTGEDLVKEVSSLFRSITLYRVTKLKAGRLSEIFDHESACVKSAHDLIASASAAARLPFPELLPEWK